VAAVVIIAAIFRKVFGWGDVLKIEIFKGLGKVMLILIPVYVYFTFLEQFTSQYVGATLELAVSDYLLKGPYAMVFWSMLILSFVFPFILLIVRRTVKGTFIAAILVTIGLWVKRVIIVVPTLVHPNLPFEIGSYSPTWVEWSVLTGIFALMMLLYSAFVKVFPIIELDIYD
jgi:molybdopterin-containing oxidoreductase family membrane subunit